MLEKGNMQGLGDLPLMVVSRFSLGLIRDCWEDSAVQSSRPLISSSDRERGYNRNIQTGFS